MANFNIPFDSTKQFFVNDKEEPVVEFYSRKTGEHIATWAKPFDLTILSMPEGVGQISVKKDATVSSASALGEEFINNSTENSVTDRVYYGDSLSVTARAAVGYNEPIIKGGPITVTEDVCVPSRGTAITQDYIDNSSEDIPIYFNTTLGNDEITTIFNTCSTLLGGEDAIGTRVYLLSPIVDISDVNAYPAPSGMVIRAYTEEGLIPVFIASQEVADAVTEMGYTGYNFVGWNPDFNGIISISNTDIDAVFEENCAVASSLLSVTPFATTGVTVIPGTIKSYTLTRSEKPEGVNQCIIHVNDYGVWYGTELNVHHFDKVWLEITVADGYDMPNVIGISTDPNNPTIVTGNINIQIIAGELSTYTVTFTSNNTLYGTVDKTSVVVPYGTNIIANGNTISLGNELITANPNTPNSYYTYAFNNWSQTSGIITQDTAIIANFNSTIVPYTLTYPAMPTGVDGLVIEVDGKEMIANPTTGGTLTVSGFAKIKATSSYKTGYSGYFYVDKDEGLGFTGSVVSFEMNSKNRVLGITSAPKAYTLTITSKPTGVATHKVTRNGVELSNGATIYHDEILTQTATAATGYNNPTVNWTSISVTGNTTATVTSVNANTYTVKFNGNGATSGSMSDQSFTYGVAQSLTPNTFNRNYTVTYNYNGNGSANTTATATSTFNGWATVASGEKVYSDRQSVSNLTATNNATVNLFANWTLGSVTLPIPARAGYTFKGWATSSSATSGITGTYTPTSNVTLYAIWSLNSYTLTYAAPITGITSYTITRNGSTFVADVTTAGSRTVNYGDVIGVSVKVASGYNTPSISNNPFTVTEDCGISFTPGDKQGICINPPTGTGYTLTIKSITGVDSIKVTRKKSPISGSTGVLTSGATIYLNDELYVEVTPAAGYNTPSIHGTTIVVTGNVIIGESGSGTGSGTAYPVNPTLKTYTVTFVANNTSYGIISHSSITNVPYGSSISVSGDNGNKVTINGTTVTATAKAKTDALTYSFDNWSNAAGAITANRTITANFSATATAYTLYYPAKPTGVASYTISCTSSPSGKTAVGTLITGGSSSGSKTVYYEDKLSIAATAASGYNEPYCDFRDGDDMGWGGAVTVGEAHPCSGYATSAINAVVIAGSVSQSWHTVFTGQKSYWVTTGYDECGNEVGYYTSDTRLLFDETVTKTLVSDGYYDDICGDWIDTSYYQTTEKQEDSQTVSGLATGRPQTRITYEDASGRLYTSFSGKSDTITGSGDSFTWVYDHTYGDVTYKATIAANKLTISASGTYKDTWSSEGYYDECTGEYYPGSSGTNTYNMDNMKLYITKIEQYY